MFACQKKKNDNYTVDIPPARKNTTRTILPLAPTQNIRPIASQT